MKAISATILTYNEEARIEECLKSLAGVAEEIIVVDSFSTDRTVDICREYGCHVTQRHLKGFGAQRQYATSLTTHSYVLSIDADEVLSPRLAQSIIKLKEEGFTHRIYAMSRLNFYCGRPVHHCGWYPDVQIRLFDKRYANGNLRDVAERVIFRDSVRPCIIDGDILHYRCDTPTEYTRKERTHADMRANVLAASRTRITSVSPLIHGVREFMHCYITKQGISDGLTGLAIASEKYRCARIAWSKARALRKKNDR